MQNVLLSIRKNQQMRTFKVICAEGRLLLISLAQLIVGYIEFLKIYGKINKFTHKYTLLIYFLFGRDHSRVKVICHRLRELKIQLMIQ